MSPLKKFVRGLYEILFMRFYDWGSFWFGWHPPARKIIEAAGRHRIGTSAVTLVEQLATERGDEPPTRETITRHNNRGFWSE